MSLDASDEVDNLRMTGKFLVEMIVNSKGQIRREAESLLTLDIGRVLGGRTRLDDVRKVLDDLGLLNKQTSSRV